MLSQHERERIVLSWKLMAMLDKADVDYSFSPERFVRTLYALTDKPGLVDVDAIIDNLTPQEAYTVDLWQRLKGYPRLTDEALEMVVVYLGAVWAKNHNCDDD